MAEVGVDNFVAVGLDVGSQNARICISNKSSSTSPSASNISIVPNEIGQRYSLALSAPEPEIESDPMNDQYWDDPKKKKNTKNGKHAKREIHHLHGDAARKSLHRLKKPLAPHAILNMVREDSFNDEEFEDSKISCESYFNHLINLTTNTSHTNPQNLRLVLSTPCPPTSATANSQSNGNGDDASSQFLKNLTSSVQRGILKTIEQAGYKKSDKKTIFAQKRIVAVLTHPIAIAHAHELFQTTDDSSLSSSIRNVVIADWGASALSLTHLKITPNNMALIETHSTYPSLSGTHILRLLVEHIAQLFERKHRFIPAGETVQNKKARAKLEIAAEDALRSFGFSQKVTITIDGLYEGMDCHVDVMLARYEMLMGNILRTAEETLKSFVNAIGTSDVSDAGQEKITVIGAGSITRMKCVERLIDRLFPQEQYMRGQSVNDIPPEEAVAMGCAMYGSTLISSPFGIGLLEEHKDTMENNDEGGMLVDEEVVLCPCSIGLSLVEGDPAAHVLIEKDSPLPILVTKKILVAGCSSNSINVVQINQDEEKLVGRIEGFDSAASKSVEFTMELSIDGKLSLSLNGGKAIEI